MKYRGLALQAQSTHSGAVWQHPEVKFYGIWCMLAKSLK